MLSQLKSSALVRFISRSHFRKEVTLIIILKLVALFTIWGICFSHLNVKQQLRPEALIQHFIH